jgi:hypothetical protein
MDIFIALGVGWFVGAICGGTAYMLVYRRNTKEGTPSASHNNARDEIRLIAESVVSCIEAGKYDNAKVLAESIVAELSPVA